ncbi:MAG: hypothetical protein J0I98_20625 [Mesorhizobium sp.]|nr:PC4/YdbC family ssDNA-binding protein [Mesorhizobium sp.]MBN9245189.1 hypothetical protein [Mesorhizobium sp.]
MDTIIATIPKTKTEEIRLSLDKYNGRDVFGARVWFESNEGDKRPGRSGIAFRVSLLPEFVGAVTKALDEAKKRGLL